MSNDIQLSLPPLIALEEPPDALFSSLGRTLTIPKGLDCPVYGQVSRVSLGRFVEGRIDLVRCIGIQGIIALSCHPLISTISVVYGVARACDANGDILPVFS